MAAFNLRFSLPFVLLAAGLACSHRTSSSAAAAQPGPSRGNVVTAQDIERYPGKPIEEILEERVAGVEVVRAADGSLALRIRGASSANSPTEPLYVIDGVPAVSGPTGGLSGLNRHEILSIEVLKDPAATAMYGVRGANGVVVVKTKRLPPREP
jgi:TonB-dependent SusC/RagA subfamily outer membrane receptor